MWPLSRKPAAAKGKAKVRPKKPTRGRADPIRWRRVLRVSTLAWALIAGVAGGLVLVYDGYLARAARAVEDGVKLAVADAGLRVREVYVTGRERSEQDEIIAALGLRQGDPILGFDPDQARAKLLALPWVKAATVTRLLPSTVEVAIVERDPLALWRSGKGRTLIDRDGAPIAVSDLEPFRHLPVVQGDDAPENAAALLDALRADPGLYEEVQLARRVGGRRWDVVLTGGIAVHLPENQLQAAWRQLANLANDEGLFERDIVAVDLRVPDRLVVRLSPEAAARRRDPGRKT
ncbi:MAG: FtsQ-type POTRA domain-containing protein [Alphaproteobacteria bacterium]